jgi:hypothetical protein
VLPDQIEPGQTYFLISDLFALEEHTVKKHAQTCQQEDASFRVVHLMDPEEFALLGLGRVGATVRDRTEWTEDELKAAYALRANTMKAALDAAGGFFVSISTDLTIGSCVERLTEGGILA